LAFFQFLPFLNLLRKAVQVMKLIQDQGAGIKKFWKWVKAKVCPFLLPGNTKFSMVVLVWITQYMYKLISICVFHLKWKLSSDSTIIIFILYVTFPKDTSYLFCQNFSCFSAIVCIKHEENVSFFLSSHLLMWNFPIVQ
jgi:hypothetical protein